MWKYTILFFLIAITAFGAEPIISPSLDDNDFPLEPGIMVLTRTGEVKGFYPVSGDPSDVDSIPGRQEFAVVTASGSFIIFSGNGERIFNTHIEGLQDVDALKTDGDFLLTSRSEKKVFIYNRLTGKRQDIPYPFEGPEDADLLENGNLLVCDAKANNVIEITAGGGLVWKYDTDLLQPVDALRLPNGNTVISDFDHHHVLEVKPNGEIKTIRGGFEHPRKLSLLDNDSILVADSDHQLLQEITQFGQQSIVRGRLNYIQSAVFVPNEQLLLCAVQNRFPPTLIPDNKILPVKESEEKPQPADTSSRSFTPLWQNHALMLGLGFLLWIVSLLAEQGTLVSRYAFLIAYGLTLSVLFQTQTEAAASKSHFPQPSFWIGTILLILLSYRFAKRSFKSGEIWNAGDPPMAFSYSMNTVFLLLTGSLLAAAAQIGHLFGFGEWGKVPWIIPMVLWGVMVYILLRPLAKSQDEYGKLSALQVGSFKLGVPFTTGSVTMDSDEDRPRDESGETPFSAYWANTSLILLLVLGAALYTIAAASVPTDVHGDECEVGLHAIDIRDSGNWNFFNLSWYHIPNLFYLIPGWVMWLFGDNLFGLRMAGGLTGLASIPIFYLLARRLLYPTPAALAAFLFTVSTFFVHFSRMGTGYTQATLFTVAVLYVLVRGLQDSDDRFIALAGLLSAVGFLSYQAAKILLPLSLVTLFFFWVIRTLSWQRLRVSVGAYLLAFWVGILPIAGINAIATDTLFSRAKGVSVFSQDGRNLIRYDFSPNVSMKEIMVEQFRRSLLAPITYHDQSPYLLNNEYGGMLDPFPAIFFMAGFFMLFLLLRHPTAWLLLLWSIPVLLIGSAITDHAPSFQRLVGLFPILILIAAPVLHGGLLGIGQACRWTVRTRLLITTAVLAVLLVMGMHRYFHQIMSKPQMVDEWTRVARYLDESGPAQYTYFFGPPHVYIKYGTIRFLAPNAQGENVEDAQTFLKTKVRRRGPVSFVLIRSHRRHINDLRRLYPDGREELHYNIEGQDPFTTYEVNL